MIDVQKELSKHKQSTVKHILIPEYSLHCDKYKPILIEIGKKSIRYNTISSVEDLCNICIGDLKLHHSFTEHLYVFMTDLQNHIIGIAELSHGSHRETPVPIKELLIILLLSGANRFYLLHNHPSNVNKLSAADFNAVSHIQLALNNLDLDLIDSVVITNKGEYTSYYIENNYHMENN